MLPHGLPRRISASDRLAGLEATERIGPAARLNWQEWHGGTRESPMDGRRFDGIARGWAGGANRRTALRSLASLLLAAWGAGKGLRGAGAQEHWPTRCASTADCRAGLPDECVRANCWSGRCGYVCCDAVFSFCNDLNQCDAIERLCCRSEASRDVPRLICTSMRGEHHANTHGQRSGLPDFRYSQRCRALLRYR
jgi:hypothetical protein